MSVFLKKTAIGYIATAVLCSSLLATLPASAQTNQPMLSSALSKETRKPTDNPVLARHATARPETTSGTTQTETKREDKKTIGRCWNRLMNMVREVSHAHKSTKK